MKALTSRHPVTKLKKGKGLKQEKNICPCCGAKMVSCREEKHIIRISLYGEEEILMKSYQGNPVWRCTKCPYRGKTTVGIDFIKAYAPVGQGSLLFMMKRKEGDIILEKTSWADLKYYPAAIHDK